MKVREIIFEDVTERNEKFEALASAQRGYPEHAMLKVQHHLLGAGVYGMLLEHVGDLTHRMSEHVSKPFRTGFGYNNVKDKVEKCLNVLDSDYGFEREFRNNLLNNYKYRESKGEKRTFTELIKEFDQLGINYAQEHEKLIVYNHVQQLAKNAAVALGYQKFNDARINLHALDDILQQGKEAWIAEASKYNPTNINEGKASKLDYKTDKRLIPYTKIKLNVPIGKAHDCQDNSARANKKFGLKTVVGWVVDKKNSKIQFRHAWNTDDDENLIDTTLGSEGAEEYKYYGRIVPNSIGRSGIAIDREFYK